MPEVLSGVIERVTFHNLDNGYCVLRVQARGHRDAVVVVGHLSQALAGEYIEATGEWITDRNFGQQFKASELRTTPPHTKEGIAKYLASGMLKGIGPQYARKIVATFGDKTLDVLDKNPAALAQVKGLGKKRIEKIREGWHEQMHVRSIMVFLQSYGIGTARAVRIYKTYGETAIEQVRSNPYKLSSDIWGVGFQTADELALKLGIPRDSPLRARAAIRHVLKDAASDGHVGLPEEILVGETVRLTGIEESQVHAAIEDLRTGDEVIRETPSDLEPLVYLKPLYLAEVGLARAAFALQQGAHPLPNIDTGAALKWVEAKLGLTFAEGQRDAVKAATREKLLVLTGGPGTGKTTIVRAIVEIFAAKNLRIGLCAPTGRAAKRLSESTGREAKTVHRLLEYDASILGFRRTADHPLDFDLLVIDEASMADVSLAYQLFRAVPEWAAVLVVGDRDQLPSVGPGSVLGDFIRSGVVPVVRLTHIHRQAEESWIIRAAHAVNDGMEPISAPPGGAGDFYFIETDDDTAIVDKIRTLVNERIPARFGLDPIRDVQVLSPMNKGTIGVKNLNQELQAALNPPAEGMKEVLRLGTALRVGDKVIQTRNNYQREVFNGDIGYITAIDSIEQLLTVEIDNRSVLYDFGDLDEIQLAYCCSIHKSQGSEYPAVVIPLHTTHYIMLRRNLLYTGLTRGKKLVVVVGSRKALGIAVRTTDSAMRYSLLEWRLRKGFQSPPVATGGLA